jgi:imidazolonepropionase-like amidohydrolase
MRKIVLLLVSLLTVGFTASAQESFPTNGVRDNRVKTYALTNATIVVDAQTTIDKGVLIIKNGIIENVGVGIPVPKDAIEINCAGKRIYPAFIDVYSTYGQPESKRSQGGNDRGPQFISNKKGAYHWNEAIRPETEAGKQFTVNSEKAASLREQGFGAVSSFSKDGIARGSAVMVFLGEQNEHQTIIKDNLAAYYSFNKGTSNQDYPSSLMGSIALLRQSFYDAEWYAKNKAEYNISYAKLNEQKALPSFFECSELYDIFRAQKIAKEFSRTFIYKGVGTEYQRAKELKALNVQLVIPINYPKAYDVEDYYDAENVSLAELKHWELASANLAMLEKEGIAFAITASDLKNTGDFLSNLRKAVKAGLTEKQALNSLTSTPAQMLMMGDQIGAIKKGMKANVLVTTGNIFTDAEAVILQNWVAGEPFKVEDEKRFDIRGDYALQIDGKELTLQIKGAKDKPELQILSKDSSISKVSYTWNDVFLSMIFDSGDTSKRMRYRMSGVYMQGTPSKIQGEARLAEKVFSFTAVLQKPWEEKKKEEEKDAKVAELGKVIYPFGAYGQAELPTPKKFLFKNATVWTNEKDGKLENTDVLVDGGKIVQVGKNLAAGSAKVVDATGKHITAGIIDEHSHIAISRGVNEGTQAVTSEVSISDVLDPEDVNIYRQLAGGVTASHLLHGSANPVGGQSGFIKLRWGKNAEELKFEKADGFIKFALGENVKQSNWGDDQRDRFPQTRMGVEQVYVDAFTRAREYQKQAGNPARRRDLELDALVEILESKRFITCHSYVQSEINMLMKVAESFDFRVNTFTHILEGYKVADKMKAHGAAASTFSDWWAYKYEVIDAIPYNAALMSKVGLNVAINSDDAEMARRLNQEAAKAVKYGNISEEEALKMVTLNPAKMMHVDDRVGSIKVGKSADLVLWSDHPLSVYAKPVYTLVDGVDYYSQERDAQLRKEIAVERERIIQKLLEQKKLGEPTQKPSKAQKKLYHCDDAENEVSY